MAAILVVEDDPDTNDLLVLILSRMGGYEVIGCRDGEEAYRKLGEATVVVSDARLFGEGAFVFVRKALEAGKPIVLVTGLKDWEIPPDIMRAITYLQKPFSPQELLKLTASALRPG